MKLAWCSSPRQKEASKIPLIVQTDNLGPCFCLACLTFRFDLIFAHGKVQDIRLAISILVPGRSFAIYFVQRSPCTKVADSQSHHLCN